MREIHFQTIDSTNTYAKEHKNEFAKDEITCITADEQTSGKGRYQRTWVSPKDAGIYATFYFTLPKTTRQIGSIAQVMALSFAKVLLHLAFKPEIKWPNDVRLKGKKVSGILCEISDSSDFFEFFLGIGINVNMDEQAASQIDQPATSLFIESGIRWNKKELLKRVQDQFTKDLLLFKKEGFTPFHKQLDELLALKGEMVRFHDGANVWEGICHSLSSDGQLNLLLSDNTIQTLSSGDILK